MHKRFLSLAAITLFALAMFAVPMAHAESDGVNTDVELTKEQKDELAILHKTALDQQVGIVNKFVEFGIFTEEKGQEVISFMEKHYKEMEKNDFIPKYDKKHKKHRENDE